MNKWKQVQKYLGLLFLPSIASVFFLGLALHGHGIIRVSVHILRNIVFLISRLPSAISMLWSEHSPTKDSDSKRYTFLILIIGMPFLLILILLEDYDS